VAEHLALEEREIPPRFTLTNGPLRRRLFRCTARATSSLPVPLSPVISTDASVGATRPIISSMRTIFGSVPMMFEKSKRSSSSARVASVVSEPSRASAPSDRLQHRRVRPGFVTKSAAPRFIPDRELVSPTRSSEDRQRRLFRADGSSGRLPAARLAAEFMS
jgi:hypothetical protein